MDKLAIHRILIRDIAYSVPPKWGTRPDTFYEYPANPFQSKECWNNVSVIVKIRFLNSYCHKINYTSNRVKFSNWHLPKSVMSIIYETIESFRL